MRRLASTLSAVVFAVATLSCGGGPHTKNIVMEPEQIVAERPTEPKSAEPAVAPKPPEEPPPPVLAFPDDEFRKKQPEAGPARPLQLPKINTFKLKNGVTVYLAESHVLPTVQGALVFEGGSMNDPADKSGLANLCMSTLSDSTASLDKEALAEQLADMASDVGGGAGLDQQSLGFRTLSKNLDATADLWAQMLLTPGLRQEDFDRNVANAKASLKQRKGSAGGVAGLLWGSIYYGAGHPFGHISSDATFDAVKLDDCKAYVKAYLAPTGARLFIVGDVNKKQVEDLMNKRFAKWTGKPKASVKLPKPTAQKGKIFFVDVPGAPQSVIYMANPGPDRKAKDFFATSLAGQILGGNFTGRINMNIREDKGYAYGAFGNFQYLRAYGMFRAAASVRADVTDKSVIELYKEISGMATGEIKDEELTREKNNMIFSLPADFETAGDVLAAFQSLVYYGLPLDYFKSYVDQVGKVDKKAAEASAHKYLRPKDLVILVVGDKATVLPGLQKLIADKTVGEGELVILDADGKVVP